ncbi:hypothetical protein DdX_20720 [Ditylenchus destructor]|uniref:Uncharacterized protein n=1 Tax=Ditylenchus destructor TaxID=166010 RepID=A0AAD4QWA4_9BILA|nr:hypothetical protein DdX_20720 [Ditylenchus destructor]
MVFASPSRLEPAPISGLWPSNNKIKIVLEEIESVGIFKDFLLAVSPLRIQMPQVQMPQVKIADIQMRGSSAALLRDFDFRSHSSGCAILKQKSDQLREPGSHFLFHIIADRIEE